MAGGIVFKSRLLTRGVYRALDQLRNLGENPAPLLEIWGGLLENSTRNRFDTGKGPGGVPWPPSKRVQKYGGKTLVDKNNLERAVTFIVEGKTLYVGVDGVAQSVKNAKSHQFGVNRTVDVKEHSRLVTSAFGVPLATPKLVKVRAHRMKMNIPVRAFLGVDNNDRRDMTEAAQDYVKGLLK